MRVALHVRWFGDGLLPVFGPSFRIQRCAGGHQTGERRPGMAWVPIRSPGGV